MKKVFFTVMVMLAGAVISVAAFAQRTSKGDAATRILTLVNKHRAELGLKPLKMNDAISAEAAKHSRNMASGSVSFGHGGFDARYDRLTTTIKSARSMAENVAYNSTTAERAVDGWLHSAGHKKNIEGDYTLTGIGIARGADGQIYYTQIFVKN